MNYSLEKLISFYKEVELYDESVFDGIIKRLKVIPNNLVKNDFFGVFPKIDGNGLLYDFVICVPKINDLNSFLVNLHEFAHAICLYKNLGKVFKVKFMDEVLPKALERIYLNNNEDLETIKKYDQKDLEKYETTPSTNHKNAIFMQFLVAKNYEDTKTVTISYSQKLPDINTRDKIVKSFLKHS
jgi:hypothetical protein